MVGCEEDCVQDTLACVEHAQLWRKHTQRRSQGFLHGLRWVLRQPNDRQAWQQENQNNQQAHDEEQPEPIQQHYFSPGQFYCVETITALCGVVIAWTKFDKSESPTKILRVLGNVFPDADEQPTYVCIDKACVVLRTAAASCRWEEWEQTTRFIVDTYHCINHKRTNELCQMYCNPAPIDGSAPNLVGERVGDDGQTYQVSCFFIDN